MNAKIVVGNPRTGSRTRQAAELVAARFGFTAETVELAELGAGLLTGDDATAEAVSAVKGTGFVVFASPTFKATFTGLLKLFLERFEGGTGLAGVVAVPLMLGGNATHSLAPEVHLRPVLSELGALTLPGLYLIDSTFTEDGVIDAYCARWSTSVQRLVSDRPQPQGG